MIRVGLVATYANWKGQDVFLDALARLPSSGPLVRGYVIGGPIYATAASQFTLDELQQRAAANGLDGRVGFIPFQTDTADVYRMLDVVVHASVRPEPFGLTNVEAMSCGKPVIVSAAGGAVELFTPDVDGLGHAPGDTAGLAAAIARLCAAPNSRSARFQCPSHGRGAVLAGTLRSRDRGDLCRMPPGNGTEVTSRFRD